MVRSIGAVPPALVFILHLQRESLKRSMLNMCDAMVDTRAEVVGAR